MSKKSFVRRVSRLGCATARSAVPSSLLVILSFAASASAAGLISPGNNVCAACQLAAMMQQQPTSVLTPGASTLGVNVASIVHHPALVSYPAAQNLAATANHSASWSDPSAQPGSLPGSLQRRWTFADTNFDPSFRTPFWSDETGPINDPTAPWNQFLPASPYSSVYFAIGRQLALGSAPLAPQLVWLPAGPAAVAAPPQATAGGAALGSMTPSPVMPRT